MTAKEYLGQYRSAMKEIERRREEIAQLEALAEYASPRSDRGGSGVSDRVGRLAAKLADERAALQREIEGLMELREEIKAVIGGVSDPTFRQLLMLRYINGFTFERIAEEMYYTYKWVFVLHGRALAAVEQERKASEAS